MPDAAISPIPPPVRVDVVAIVDRGLAVVTRMLSDGIEEWRRQHPEPHPAVDAVQDVLEALYHGLELLSRDMDGQPAWLRHLVEILSRGALVKVQALQAKHRDDETASIFLAMAAGGLAELVALMEGENA